MQAEHFTRLVPLINAQQRQEATFILMDAFPAGAAADDFHSLNGFNPTRYTVHVNGPWYITFEFDGTDATRVDFEQYH